MSRPKDAQNWPTSDITYVVLFEALVRQSTSIISVTKIYTGFCLKPHNIRQ